MLEMLNGEKHNINKKDFILKLSAKSQLSIKQTEEAVTSILLFLKQCFERPNCTIEIRGFGKFVCKNGSVKFKHFT